MAEMGMKQDAQEYQKQQDSVNRDLQLLNTTQTLTKQTPRKREVMTSKLNKIWETSSNRKSLRRWATTNERMSNLNWTIKILENFDYSNHTIQKTATQNQLEMIKAAMSQGATYQDTVNQVMGTGGGNIAKMTAMSESGADYGQVSSGKWDAGGVSYGAYQLSSTRWSAQSFIDTMGYIDALLETLNSWIFSWWREMGKPIISTTQDQ